MATPKPIPLKLGGIQPEHVIEFTPVSTASLEDKPQHNNSHEGKVDLSQPISVRIRQKTRNGQTLLSMLVEHAAGKRQLDRTQLDAIDMLLSRGWGKPITPIAADIKWDVTERILADLSDDQLAALIAESDA